MAIQFASDRAPGRPAIYADAVYYDLRLPRMLLGIAEAAAEDQETTTNQILVRAITAGLAQIAAARTQ